MEQMGLRDIEEDEVRLFALVLGRQEGDAVRIRVDVKFAYGEGKVGGRDALLVATEGEGGQGRLTIRIRPLEEGTAGASRRTRRQLAGGSANIIRASRTPGASGLLTNAAKNGDTGRHDGGVE
jgi:hypothetical protein